MAVKDNLIVQDVFESVIIERDSGGSITQALFFGVSDESSISHSLSKEALRGGIGNGTLGYIYGDRECKFKVNSVFNQDNMFALKLGDKFSAVASQKVYIPISGRANASNEITNTLIKTGYTVVRCLDEFNVEVTLTTPTVADGSVSATELTEGQDFTIILEGSVDGDMISLTEGSLPESREVHLHTVAYNPKTNEVVADIYYIFNNAVPVGDFDRTYSNGQSNKDEIEFEAMVDGSGDYFHYLVVPRA